MTRKAKRFGTALVVQWLRLYASNAGGAGSIPGQGTKKPLFTIKEHLHVSNNGLIIKYSP